MRPHIAAGLAALVAACAEPYQPATPREAAALARCQAQAYAATAAIPDPVQIAVGRLQVQNSCMQAWQLDWMAENQAAIARFEAERRAQAAAATTEADARARAERDCRGARNRDACIQGVVALARAQPASSPAPAASTGIATVNRGPATSDRPSYSW